MLKNYEEETLIRMLDKEIIGIKFGATTKKVNITEIDVLEGRVVRVE